MWVTSNKQCIRQVAYFRVRDPSSSKAWTYCNASLPNWHRLQQTSQLSKCPAFHLRCWIGATLGSPTLAQPYAARLGFTKARISILMSKQGRPCKYDKPIISHTNIKGEPDIGQQPLVWTPCYLNALALAWTNANYSTPAGKYLGVCTPHNPLAWNAHLPSFVQERGNRCR